MTGEFRDRIDRPLFIVSAPRSGSTLFYETLRKAPGLFSTGRESHQLIEGVPGLAVAEREWHSNRLDASDATESTVEMLARRFYATVSDREGAPPQGPVRMLEKTPKNALRVPFFDAAFDGAHFLFLYRDARQTLASMLEAWQSGYFRTYPQLPGWQGPPWSLLLPPGWREWSGRPLPEIVARQWATSVSILVNDLEAIGGERVRAISYDAFLKTPQSVVERVCAWIGIDWDVPLGASLPLSKTTVSAPDPDKWRHRQREIQEIWPIVAAVDERARRLLAARAL